VQRPRLLRIENPQTPGQVPACWIIAATHSLSDLTSRTSRRV
jgi:hypothetical protein